MSLDSQCTYTNIDGIKTRYIKKGKGKNLILIPGWRCDIDRVIGVIDFFADHRTVYCMDFPGYGKTDQLKGKHTFTKLARFMKTWVDTLGLKKYSVAGLSMGAPLTTHLIAIEDKAKISHAYLIIPWANTKSLRINRFVMAFVKYGSHLAFRSGTICWLGDKVFNSPRFIRFALELVEGKDSLKDVDDLMPFARSWGRFSFKVSMEYMYETAICDMDEFKHNFSKIPASMIVADEDPYIDTDTTFSTYQNIYPQLNLLKLEEKFHAPRNEITKEFMQKKFGDVAKRMID